jgi:hypothetical protein
MIVRKMCEAYPGLTPKQIGDMTYDQIWVLVCDEKDLERRRLATGTPQELISLGILPPLEDFQHQQRKQKRQARRMRLAKIKEQGNGSS